MADKHTPGPWWVAYPVDRSCGDIGIKANGCANILAEVFEEFEMKDVFNAPVASANARLIAAAPELLEALEEAVATVDDDREWVCLARAVIAKARGGK